MGRTSSSTFGHYGHTEPIPRPWFAAFFASSAIYIGLGIAAAVLGVGTRQMVSERPVDVTFVEKVVKEEPPPPPKIEEAKPAPPPPPAPVVPKEMKVRKLDKPPPPKELLAPKEMPKEAAKEADPSLDKGIAVFGEPGEGDPAGLEGGYQAGAVGNGPTALPQGAVAPKPLKTNQPPPYPKTARNAGKTGSVTLKITIAADGHVTDVQVVDGEEPFVSAAVEAVKKWKYEPARYKGQPIAVYRIIQVGFQLNA